MSYTRRNFTFEKFIKDPGPFEGMENEISPHGGIPLPWEVVLPPSDLSRRDMGISTLSQGGALVGQKVIPELVSFARSKMICGKAGATLLTGLPMSNALPWAKAGITAEWLAEHASTTAADISIGQLSFSPLRVSATVQYSTLLRTQSETFEDALRAEIVKGLALAVDQGALLGAGGVQPLGAINTPGIQTITFGGAPTFAKLASMPQAIQNANLDVDSEPSFAISPDVEFFLRTNQRGSGLSSYLMDDDGRIAGRKSISTTTLNAANANNRVLCLAWPNLYIAWFGSGPWFTLDPYSLSPQGERKLTVHCYIDSGLVRPLAACVSTDAGNI